MENESYSHVENAQFAQGTGVNLETVTPEDPFCAQSQLPSEGLGIVNTDKFCLIRLSTVELTLPLEETPGNTRLDRRKPNESSHLLFGSDTI
jgi:hypothetical protein